MKGNRIIFHVVCIAMMLLLLFLNEARAEALATPDENKTVEVFVDPYSGELVVNNSVSDNYAVRVFDLTGKEVLKAPSIPETPIRRFDISALRKGIYLVNVQSATSQQAVTVKIMLK